MRPKTLTLTAVVLDRNGVSVAQKPVAAGNLTITGVLASGGIATFDISRHVGIYSDADDSSDTFTVYGTDRNGAVISEEITGPNTTTANGSKNFKTVTRVAIDKAATGNIEVGTTNQFDSQIVPVDSYTDNISYAVYLSAAASLTYNFKYTMSDIFAAGFLEADAVFLTDQGPKTVSTDSRSAGPFRACRLEITGFTSGTITWHIITAHK